MKLISKLNISEFIQRMDKHTKPGSPEVKGYPIFSLFTLFGQTEKIFFGEYNQRGFRITRNSSIHTFFIPYIFEGVIRPINDSKTEIIFNIRRMWYAYLGLRIPAIFSLIFFNIILTVYNSPIGVYIFFNIFILLTLIPLTLSIRYKNQLFREFFRIFEVEEITEH